MSLRLRLTAAFAIVALLTAGAVALATGRPALSDAAAYWCGQAGNYGPLHDAAASLGIGDETLIVVQYNGAAPWPKPTDVQRADYAKACNAAFGSR